jgi:hypothetical protein
LVQSQGGVKFQPAGILKYFEELKREFNAGFGSKDIFKIASINMQLHGNACIDLDQVEKIKEVFLLEIIEVQS